MISFELEIVTKDDVMTLPRILQVISRRGYRLRKLETELTSEGVCQYKCLVEGDARWQESLPGLIAKLEDVKEVRYV